MNIIGIDVGGTKSSFVLFDKDGNYLDKVILDSVHFMQKDKETIKKILLDGINILVDRNSITEYFVSAGIAGYGKNNEIRNYIDSLFLEILPLKNYALFSDIEIALTSALGKEDGIVVIGGTGSIAMSRINNEIKRSGGWGYLIGDEGSSYDIAKKSLSIFSKQADGRLIKTNFYYRFKEKLNLENDYDLINIARNEFTDRTKLAKITKIIYELAKENDEYALNLFKEAANELVLMINSLNNNDTKLTVSYVGGLFNAKDIILPFIEEKLAKNLILKPPLHIVEKGAYILALEKLRKVD